MIFARMLMDQNNMSIEDFNTYIKLFDIITNFMKNPNLIVYLKISAKESKRRIEIRNREIESDITLEYLKDLCSRYDDFANKISKSIPVIQIDYDEFKDENEIAKKIKEEWEKMMNIKKMII